jgi:hypothetical protein
LPAFRDTLPPSRSATWRAASRTISSRTHSEETRR